MPTTINELRVKVETNTLDKMQYFCLFDRFDTVLDQCPYNTKLIQGNITHSNIYRATSALFFSFSKLNASSEYFKIKK